MRTLSLMSALVLALGVAACSDDDDKDCIDLDGDGYGEGVDCDGTDCDDDDAAAWASLTGYVDADGDSYGDATAMSLCTDGTLPAGYVDNGTDCDDADESVWAGMTGHADVDGDGFGDASAIELCTDGTLPAGYVDDDTDCDDNDAAINEIVSGYDDYDSDGVYSAALAEACTDGTLPTGWQTTAGTDCDDFDMTASVDGSDIGCQWAGFCVDTEMLGGVENADFLGIGACGGADCDGSDPACFDPTPTAQTTTCTTDDDCATNQDEYCMGGFCQEPPACCEYDPAGLTCYEIVGCLSECKATYVDPADAGLLALCLQMTCYENATPKAQYLYAIAQDCAAEAGCFAAEDMEACASANCITSFGACMLDAPAP